MFLNFTVTFDQFNASLLNKIVGNTLLEGVCIRMTWQNTFIIMTWHMSWIWS